MFTAKKTGIDLFFLALEEAACNDISGSAVSILIISFFTFHNESSSVKGVQRPADTALAWRAQTGGRTGVREGRRDKFGRREEKDCKEEIRRKWKRQAWAEEERRRGETCLVKHITLFSQSLTTTVPPSAHSIPSLCFFFFICSPSLHLPPPHPHLPSSSSSSCCFYLSSHLISLLILFHIPLGMFLRVCICWSFFKVFVLSLKYTLLVSLSFLLPLIISVSVI